MKEKEFIKELFLTANVQINGNRPWDIKVLDDRFYKRLLLDRSLGLGESYMDGWWECDQIDEFINKILSAKIEKRVRGLISPSLIFSLLRTKIFNLQDKIGALEVGEKHYDIGNDFYKEMLDKRMVYTCGYWDKAKNLDEAQEVKMDLVCRKAGLKPGMKILDIGCGWGSFLKYAAEKYGISGVGITISKEQLKYAQKNVEGMNIEIRLQDYRDVTEKFDAIISIGMFEAVGQKNYREYMEMVNKNLKDNGIFLLHTIGISETTLRQSDPWLDKYIFPNGILPSQLDITKSINKLFVIEDWHNFGHYYDLTLMEWYKNFDKNWHNFRDQYGDRFYRMWKYYLLVCAGSFRSRNIHLWQIVLSKDGVKGGYNSIR